MTLKSREQKLRRHAWKQGLIASKWTDSPEISGVWPETPPTAKTENRKRPSRTLSDLAKIVKAHEEKIIYSEVNKNDE